MKPSGSAQDVLLLNYTKAERAQMSVKAGSGLYDTLAPVTIAATRGKKHIKILSQCAIDCCLGCADSACGHT